MSREPVSIFAQPGGRMWSDPASNPLEDIRTALEGVCASTSMAANSIVILRSTWMKIKRRTMTKRRYRRWRGRLKGRRG